MVNLPAFLKILEYLKSFKIKKEFSGNLKKFISP
jgi:hypothetical protein